MLGTTTTPSLVDPSSITFGPPTGNKGRGAIDTQTVGNLLVQPEGCESGKFQCNIGGHALTNGIRFTIVCMTPEGNSNPDSSD